ncbi:hypothetical protein [Magnetovirga frankeli]|uniref:hypothetical protein n=1 Tax=Magnetovirga frankeli TaxID=947516 RepID=UPI003D32B833
MNLIPAFIRRRIAHRPNLVKIVDNIGWLFFDKILRMGVGLLVGCGLSATWGRNGRKRMYLVNCHRNSIPAQPTD